VDPFVVPELDSIPRPPQTPARFKDDLTKWITNHPGVPFASVRAIAESKLVHPLHQAGLDEAAAAKSVDQDPETIEGLKNEQRYSDAFTMAMDAGKIDAVIFPTWAQLPAINGDRNTQLLVEPKPGRDAGPTRAEMILPSHGRFQFSALPKRRDYSWPSGKRLAMYVAVNVETFGFGMEIETVLGSALPMPDHRNWSWRESAAAARSSSLIGRRPERSRLATDA
jgi:hypothetical protein